VCPDAANHGPRAAHVYGELSPPRSVSRQEHARATRCAHTPRESDTASPGGAGRCAVPGSESACPRARRADHQSRHGSSASPADDRLRPGQRGGTANNRAWQRTARSRLPCPRPEVQSRFRTCPGFMVARPLFAWSPQHPTAWSSLCDSLAKQRMSSASPTILSSGTSAGIAVWQAAWATSVPHDSDALDAPTSGQQRLLRIVRGQPDLRES